MPRNKGHLLKQNIFVWTKHKTNHKRPVCLQYFITFVMLQRYRCPTLNPILGPVLGKWAWSVNLDITNNLWCFFNDSFIYFCCCCHCLCSFASKGLYQSFTKTVIPSCSWQKKRWLLRKIRKTKILCRLSKAASFRYEVGKLWY